MPPVGAFEIYMPYDPIAAAINRDTKKLYLILFGGLALLYLVLFRIVVSASRAFGATRPRTATRRCTTRSPTCRTAPCSTTGSSRRCDHAPARAV